MRNLKMTITYDGFKYKGWQKQKDNDLTIQGKIEAVLSKMTGETILASGLWKNRFRSACGKLHSEFSY